MNLKLSVLDQTPIRRGSNAQEALQESIRLAQFVDKLGYTRYWISEHHNITTLAGAAPEVFIARLASETKNLRLGSGGIMLPNHSALKVAENFRLLEALYPGRIDLGIGRAPGGDRLTASLLNPGNTFNPKDYIQQIADLKLFFTDQFTAGALKETITALPQIQTQPALWMLTSSGESAYIAAHFGMALSYAQFINPVGGADAIRTYREQFRPSVERNQPAASVGIFVFCGDTEEKVMKVQAMMDHRLLNIDKGKTDNAPSYESIKSYQYSPEERARIQYNRLRMITGTPDVVKEKLTELVSFMQVDEVVISTFADSFEDRLRSYELLSEIFVNETMTAGQAESARGETLLGQIRDR
jgi:luciferase family oxidoreductase group 1